jgi:hypothetical protein
MYLLEVRAKVGDTNLIHDLPKGLSLDNYKETNAYSAKTWLIVLGQRAALLNSIIKFNEIDFTKWIDTFKVTNSELGLSINFQAEDFICPPLDSPILIPLVDKNHRTFQEILNSENIEDAFNTRMKSLVSINRHANPVRLIKEITSFIKKESLWYKSINEVSGKRTRGFYGADKTFEKVKYTRFNRIINRHNFNELNRYQVLAYIDLTLYALLCKKKYGNKFMDSLLFSDDKGGNNQNKKIEKVTQHLANVVLMKQFLSDLAISTTPSPQ